MSSTEPTSKTARARRSRKESASSQAGEATRGREAVAISAEQRHSMIAQTAYLRAERRGFRGGDPVADWLESEKEVDSLLSRTAS